MMWRARGMKALALCVALIAAATARANDFDADDDVDLTDWSAMADCLAGPGVDVNEDCSIGDNDEDTDVDLADVAGFMNAFTGEVDACDLTGIWTLHRTLNDTDSSQGSCIFEPLGSEDDLVVTIVQDGENISLTIESNQDLDNNFLEDFSPGQTWLLFEPIFCAIGEPYIVTHEGTLIDGEFELVVPMPGTLYCNCDWFFFGFITGVVDNCEISGNMLAGLQRTCGAGQDLNQDCFENHDFVGTRNP